MPKYKYLKADIDIGADALFFDKMLFPLFSQKVKKFNAKNPSQLPEDGKQEPQNKEKN